MNTIAKAFVFLTLATSITSCSAQNASESASPAPSSSPQAHNHSAQFVIDQSTFSLKQWREDGSHITSVKGKLLLDDQPVANGVLHVSNIKRDIITGEDGSFDLTVDQSLLADTKVHVKSHDKATVSGKLIDKETSDALLAASASIGVYYPIQVIKVGASATDASQVEVHGQITAQKGDVVSFFQVDKYRIGGLVKDADGKAVQGAVVWFDRDEGEGFGKSTPTDKDGKYSIYYLPEEDETNLSVTLGTQKYTLPKGKVFIMPEETSVEINIILPREGTIIEDKPPTLVSATSPGAMYTGILVGLNVPEGTDYSVTIPDKDGRFVLTVPKQVWEQHPKFFETKMSKFIEEGKLTWGDKLPPGFVQPSANDPKNITAKLP